MSTYQLHQAILSETTDTIGNGSSFKSRTSSFPSISNCANLLPLTNLVGCISKSYSWIFAIHLALISRSSCRLSISLNFCWNIVTSKNILYVFLCGPRWFYRENHLLLCTPMLLIGRTNKSHEAVPSNCKGGSLAPQCGYLSTTWLTWAYMTDELT